MDNLTLAFITGNESENIERFIRSFSVLTKSMVMVRAVGSQHYDDTLQKAVQACQELGIKLENADYFNSNDFPHVDNFGAARQKAWSMAEKTGCKYLMWADVDDILKPGSQNEILESVGKGEHDIFLVPYHVRGTSQIVMRERIAKNDGCSKWAYPIHEQLKFTRTVSYSLLKDAAIEHLPKEGRTSSHERNMNILHGCVEDLARNYFYIHQEYFGTNQQVMAKKYGLAALYAQPPLDPLERYEVLLNLAQCGLNPKENAREAFELMPDRREALALLVNYAILDKSYEKANQLARLMIGIPKPRKTYWSMNHDWYDWKGLYLYTQTLRLNGNEYDANRIEEEKLPSPKISLLHATRRPVEALAAREMWLTRARNPNAIEHIFAIDAGDEKTLEVLGGFRKVINEKEGCVPAWNLAASKSRGEILIQLSDDWMPPLYWDEKILSRLDASKASVLAVNDGHRTDDLLCIAILTRPYYEQYGLFHESFKSVYSDNYFTWLAHKNNAVIDARDLVFHHNHPYFQTGKLDSDEVYAQSNSKERYEEGKKIFEDLTMARCPERLTASMGKE